MDIYSNKKKKKNQFHFLFLKSKLLPLNIPFTIIGKVNLETMNMTNNTTFIHENRSLYKVHNGCLFGIPYVLNEEVVAASRRPFWKI